MSAQETRNMICECVNNLLTDIPSGKMFFIVLLIFFNKMIALL